MLCFMIGRSETRRGESDERRSRPVPVRNVSVTLMASHITGPGACETRQCIWTQERGWKEAQVEGSTPEAIAQLVLSDLVRS
jgi:hypothetical protein